MTNSGRGHVARLVEALEYALHMATFSERCSWCGKGWRFQGHGKEHKTTVYKGDGTGGKEMVYEACRMPAYEALLARVKEGR